MTYALSSPREKDSLMPNLTVSTEDTPLEIDVKFSQFAELFASLFVNKCIAYLPERSLSHTTNVVYSERFYPHRDYEMSKECESIQSNVGFVWPIECIENEEALAKMRKLFADTVLSQARKKMEQRMKDSFWASEVEWHIGYEKSCFVGGYIDGLKFDAHSLCEPQCVVM